MPTDSIRSEWVIGRISAPTPRGDVLVDIFLAFEAGERRLLGVRVTGPGESPSPLTNTDAAHGSTLAAKMRATAAPRRIRARDRELARETRAVIERDVEIEVGPTPEIEALASDLLDLVDLAARVATEGATHGTTGLRELYDAAAALWIAAPWNLVEDVLPLRVTIPHLDVEDGCVLLFAGEQGFRHFTFFSSHRDCVGFLLRAMSGQRADGSRGVGVAFVSLQFRELHDAPRRVFDGWPLESAAYPVVTPFRRDGSRRPTTSEDLELMAACCRGIAAFTMTHRTALAAGASTSLEVELHDEHGAEIRLWLEAPDDGPVLH